LVDGENSVAGSLAQGSHTGAQGECRRRRKGKRKCNHPPMIMGNGTERACVDRPRYGPAFPQPVKKADEA
jgi:hypothetical protein